MGVSHLGREVPTVKAGADNNFEKIKKRDGVYQRAVDDQQEVRLLFDLLCLFILYDSYTTLLSFFLGRYPCAKF